MLRLGFHSSICNRILDAVKLVELSGENVVQIFISNPLSFIPPKLSESELLLVNQYIKKKEIKLFIHSSYLLNFCKNFRENHRSFRKLILDIEMSKQVGADGIILHCGKSLNLKYEIAIKNLVESLITIIDKTNKEFTILLENGAGQGTEIGKSLQELKDIYNLFPEKYQNYIGFCFDTAHGFASGIDLRNKSTIDNFFEQFNKIIGLDKLKVIHLNDSKKELGSYVDRHADIGYGFIGLKGLTYIAKKATILNIPMILETPCDNINYTEQINLLKKRYNLTE